VEKLMYLVTLPAAMARRDVRTLMLEDTAPQLLALDVRGLSMDLDDEEADVPPPVPPPDADEAVRAIVSVWVDAYDRRAPLEDVLRTAGRIDGYQVVESMYTEYGESPWAGSRDWPDGTRSPGLLTVAAIEMPAGRDHGEWLDYWHSTVSTVSERIQPRTRYVRNAVFRGITPDAPPYRALVEEGWPSGEHITDPMRFYCADGDPAVLEANITLMIETIAAFTDLSTLRSYTMSEWILKS
jgi:hypothetical protein